MKNFKYNKNYLYAGITAFLVIIASISFYWIIQRWSGIRDSFSSVLGILSPIIGGFVLAYLLTPFVKIYERKLFIPLGNKLFKERESKVRGFGRGMGIFLAILVLIGIIAAFFSLIIPQVYDSIVSIASNLSTSIQKSEDWATRWLKDFPGVEASFKEIVNNLGDKLSSWAEKTLLPQMNDIVASVSLGVINVVKAITNIIISVVVSVYAMFSRERFIAGGKKILYSILNVKHVNKILDALRFTDKSFMGFFTGKLIEAIIVGVLCYIGCLIMGSPDSVLIAVIVGVTDIIPFFGPFFGAIPSALIVLIYKPSLFIIFIIFIIILHQLDGNIIGPRILGDATGLGGFWVLFAIIVGGGMFGFIGMIVGVPVFAVVYAGVKTLINNRLKKSGLPSETAKYENISSIDPESLRPVAAEPESQNKENSEAKKIVDRMKANGKKTMGFFEVLWIKIRDLAKVLIKWIKERLPKTK